MLKKITSLLIRLFNEYREQIFQFVGTLLPTVFALGLQLVTFAITARGLGAAQFGLYSVVLAFAAATVELVGLGSADILVRGVARNAEKFRLYFGNMLILIAASLPLVVLLCSAIINFFADIPLGIGLVTLALLGEITVSRMSASSELVMVAFGHTIRAGWLRIFTVGMRLISACLFFLLFKQSALENWVVVVGLQGILTAFLILAMVIFLYGRPILKTVPAEVLGGLAFCANQTARAMQGNLDRMILANFASAVTLGVYSAASRMMQVGMFPLQVATRLTYPRFFVEGAKGISESRSYAVRLAPIYFLIGIGAGMAVAAASWLLPFIIGDDFDSTAIYGMFLAISLPFMALQYPAADALTGAGYQSERAVIYWISTFSTGFVMVAGASLFAAPGIVGGYILAQALLASALWLRVLTKKGK